MNSSSFLNHSSMMNGDNHREKNAFWLKSSMLRCLPSTIFYLLKVAGKKIDLPRKTFVNIYGLGRELFKLWLRWK